MNFGRLAELRRERGLTQEALAEKTGLGQNTISDLERGKRPKPNWRTLEHLAGALEMPTIELVNELNKPITSAA